ncbi:MAG TPA: hypothetical protein VKA48_10945 [Gammaproteobacteria bacterium]|nr:hypothetical protein [Gammaproteobacteria bacterium]
MSAYCSTHGWFDGSYLPERSPGKPCPVIGCMTVLAAIELEPGQHLSCSPEEKSASGTRLQTIKELKSEAKNSATAQEQGGASDRQVGGDHYKGCAIQPARFSQANGLGFLEGCIVKRVTRWNRAGGKGREDLEKIIHEAQLLLEFLDDGDI